VRALAAARRDRERSARAVLVTEILAGVSPPALPASVADALEQLERATRVSAGSP
jgi:hypothetical protein